MFRVRQVQEERRGIVHVHGLITNRRRDLQRVIRCNRDCGIAGLAAHPVGVGLDDRAGVWVDPIDEAAIVPNPAAQPNSRDTRADRSAASRADFIARRRARSGRSISPLAKPP